MFSTNINEEITAEELQHLSKLCLERIRVGELHCLRNDAKLRAVNNTKTYDEFKDIVDAAHLKPITKQDKMNAKTRNRLWNKAAAEVDD
ncbi:coiled-coil domain-containing protein 103-like [Musca domestica]|uniref:Coiled-coil domain-containing protein 103 n=1 Tax=Musca domestica TaxID=7370 RepID=A0A1I8MXY0_MUSDO|nr:coiled-coil domain-containing protein 103 [Musca domestica]XP_058984794.1 coiled-coil domain-containing protein 103-like [Musca domestica]